MMIFVSGGVRSGKSKTAELLVQQLALNEKRCVYVATGQEADEEMKHRVLLHQLQREQSSMNWVTIEKPVNVKEICLLLKKEDVVLLDCATNWLANELFRTACEWNQEEFQKSVLKKMKDAVLGMKEHASHVVIVSNELFEGSILENPTFTYMKMLGCFHQWVVKESDLALVVEAGKTGIKKGEWPGEKEGFLL